MIISEGASRLEMIASERVPDHLPTPGDTRFSIAVSAEAYSGTGSAWIDAEQLAAFVAALRSLESTRIGSAEVESMSPGEFRLRISATDGYGHMEVSGHVSRSGQSLDFRFAFCPSALPRIVSELTAVTHVPA